MKILLNIPFHTGKVPTHCLLPDAIKAEGGDLFEQVKVKYLFYLFSSCTSILRIVLFLISSLIAARKSPRSFIPSSPR